MDFRRHLGTPAQPNGVAPPTEEATPSRQPPAEGKAERDYTPLAAVGGIAVLGLMLLVGVLIGRGNNPTTATAPPPVVVRAGEGNGGATASDETAGERDEAATAKTKAKAKAKVKGKKADDASSLLGAKDGRGPVVASDDALKELEEQSGADYSENSAKLPDEIATPGAPPPKDNKAPGGGSNGTAIE